MNYTPTRSVLDAGMRSETLRTIIALLVGVVWLVAMLAYFIADDVRPLEITTPIAALVFGRVMGYQLSVKKKNGDDDS